MSRLHSYDENDVTFHYVDEHAKKATLNDADSFPNLIAYLSRETQKSKHKELCLVRGILVWIAHNQSIAREGRYNSPLWTVQQLASRRMSPADVFQTFCSHAGVECQEISGRAKAIRYRAGDGDSEYLKNHSWIAFKPDDKWHLMHPQWSVHAYVGFVHGNETVVEKDGKGIAQKRVETQGRSMYMVNDFWFCTNPEIFATRCFPDDLQWQNPGRKPFLQSISDFLFVPDLRQGFYDMKLTLLSEKSCCLFSENGKCFISVMSEKDRARAIEFSYELALEGTSIGKANVENMKQLVLYQLSGKDRNIFKFDIRLPIVGIYYFRLAVGSTDDGHDMKRNCCEFKIICKEACIDCQLFPTSMGLGYFGYGRDAEEAGLMSSSETEAKIVMPQKKGKATDGKQTVVKFKTDDDPDRDIKYVAKMYECGSDSLDDKDINVQLLDNAVVVHNKDNNELLLKANVPDGKEYSVVVTAKDLKDKTAKKDKPISAFLVKTHLDENERKNDDMTRKKQKEARTENKHKSKVDVRDNLDNCVQTMKAEIKALQQQVSGRMK